MNKIRVTRNKAGAIGGASLTMLAYGIHTDAQQAGNGVTSGTGQNGSTINIADKKVNVHAEEARLTDVVKALMAQIGANYTIDPILRGATITAHLNNVKFSTALDVVLRGATIPAEAIYEDGIYRIRVRQEPETPVIEIAGGDTESELALKNRIDHVFVNFIDAGLIARILNGTAFETTGNTYGFVPYSVFGPNFTFNTGSNGNTGAVNGQTPPPTTGASSFYTDGGGSLIINRGSYDNGVGGAVPPPIIVPPTSGSGNGNKNGGKGR